MALTQEQIDSLKKLKDAGILTEKELAAKLNPIVVISWVIKFREHIITAIKFLSLVNWSEQIKHFKYKKIALYILIGGIIYSVAYFNGKINKPVHVNFGGSEFRLVISKDETLHVYKDGTVNLEDANGNKLHSIKVKDIPALKKALMPFGLEFKPFFTVGGSIGATNQVQPEVGLGTDFFKIYKANLAAWATQYGIYLGADYYITNNSGIIVGVGHGYTNPDVRVYAGWKWNF
jgi:hypothetical protein